MASLTTGVDPSLAAPYIPRLLHSWAEDQPRHRRVEGSLVSADISGFTALSERLAAHGREGAEELTVLLNRCFGPMIEIIEAHGGDVVKFGGDALLVLFTGAEHTARAAGACVRMRKLIERRWSTPLIRDIELGISQGIHSGAFDLHLVDLGHRELLVLGPGVTRTVDCEGAADRGEILLSAEAAAELPPAMVGEPRDEGCPLVGDPGDYVWLIEAEPARPIDPYLPDWLVEQTAAGRVAEHRPVSVAFLFFGGATIEQGEDHGQVQRELEQLAAVTTAATQRHGVYCLASDAYPGGGKLILTAGAPISTGHDDDALARTVREILDADLALHIRVGINRGPVFMGDLGSERRRTFTVMGDTVNLAARLMQKAQPGQMVVERSVLDGIDGEVAATSLEPFTVKGKEKPIDASVVESIDQSTEAAFDEETAVPFVGRVEELALLQRLLDDAVAGSGAVVDLVGEPGVGKSRIVAELVARNPTVTVARTRGGIYSRRTPYLAVRSLLRDLAGCDQQLGAEEAGAHLTDWVRGLDAELVPWIPLIAVPFDARVPSTVAVDRIDASNRATKLRQVVVDLLSAALPDPSLLVVDDAHWLDEASDELFHALSQRIRSMPWTVLALRRADTSDFAVGDPDAHCVVLDDLSDTDLRELALAAVDAGLGSSRDDVDQLLGRGITNPLFLLELVRAGPGDVTPDSIESLVTARIDTLDAANRLLLRECAVLGAVVEPALLAEATEDPALLRPERWTPLSGFLERERGGHYRFQHALYRQVAFEGLSFRRRRTLHRGVGEVLERRAGDDLDAMSERLSLHFHEAREWRRSWKYSEMAGERARTKYANVEAAGFYERALESARRHRVPREDQARVAEALGDVAELAAHYGQADAALTRARRACDDEVMKVRLLRKEGTLKVRQGRFTQGLRWYGRGLTAAADLVDRTAREHAEGQLCLAYAGARFRQGKSRECVRWAQQAEQHARAVDDSPMLAHALYLMGIGHNVQRAPEAPAYLERSLELFEAEGDLLGSANVLNNLGVDAKDDGRWDDAIDFYERSRVAREQTGDVVGAATASNNIAEILSDQGHYDRAEELFEEALRIWRRADFSIGIAIATSYLGRLHGRRGDAEKARTLLSDAVEQFRTIGAAHYVLETQVFELECDLLYGRADVLAQVEVLLDDARRMEDVLLLNILLRFHSWALEQLGDHDAAIEAVNTAIRADEETNTPFELALALIVRGQIHRAMGLDRDADHQRARSILEGLGVVSLPPIRSRVSGVDG